MTVIMGILSILLILSLGLVFVYCEMVVLKKRIRGVLYLFGWNERIHAGVLQILIQSEYGRKYSTYHIQQMMNEMLLDPEDDFFERIKNGS